MNHRTALIVEPFESLSQMFEDLHDPDKHVKVTLVELTEENAGRILPGTRGGGTIVMGPSKHTESVTRWVTDGDTP